MRHIVQKWKSFAFIQKRGHWPIVYNNRGAGVGGKMASGHFNAVVAYKVNQTQKERIEVDLKATEKHGVQNDVIFMQVRNLFPSRDGFRFN